MGKAIVIFRKWKEKDGIIALFPLLKNETKDKVKSFSLEDQIFYTSYEDTIKESVLATEVEYMDTKNALEGLGYNLSIKSRKPNPKRLNEKLLSSITSWVYDVLKDSLERDDNDVVYETIIKGITIKIVKEAIPSCNSLGFTIEFDKGVDLIIQYPIELLREASDTALLAKLTQDIKHALYGR